VREKKQVSCWIFGDDRDRKYNIIVIGFVVLVFTVIVMNGGLPPSEQSADEMFYGDGSFRYGQRDALGNMKEARSGDTYSRGSFGDHTKKK
jgi:hypothetical protein